MNGDPTTVIRRMLDDDELTLARWGIGDDGTSVLYEDDDDELRAALAALLAEDGTTTVPREAFVALMADYLESEGKRPTPEQLEDVCRDWLGFWQERQA